MKRNAILEQPTLLFGFDRTHFPQLVKGSCTLTPQIGFQSAQKQILFCFCALSLCWFASESELRLQLHSCFAKLRASK